MPFKARRRMALFFALAVLAPASASATKIAMIVRGAGAGSDKAAGYVGHFVRYYLTEDGRYEVIDNSERLGVDSSEATKAFKDAADLVKKAMAAYETLDLDPAVDYLTTAVQKYEKNVAFIADIKPLADALVLLGAVYILRGDEKSGIERLAQALTVSPTVEPDPRIFNPSMRQVFQKTADQVSKKPRGSISVTSNPSYAELYVDGVFKGIAPITADQLPAGRHYVRMVRDGYRSYGSIVTVNGSRETAENGSLKPAKQYDSYDKAASVAIDAVRSGRADDDKLPDDSLLKFDSLLGAEQLFAAEVTLDGEQVKVVAAQYDLKARRHFKTVAQVFTYDLKTGVFEREISDLLRTQFGETTLGKKTSEGAVAGGGRGSGDCMGMSCKKFKNIAVFGGLGGGVVLGGTGILLYVMASKDHADYRNAPQTSPQAASLRSSGKTKALVGDILVSLGVIVVAAGAGTYIFYQPAAPAEPATAKNASASGGFNFAIVPLPGGAAALAGTRF